MGVDTRWIWIGLAGTLVLFFGTFFLWRALHKSDTVAWWTALTLGAWLTYSVLRITRITR